MDYTQCDYSNQNYTQDHNGYRQLVAASRRGYYHTSADYTRIHYKTQKRLQHSCNYLFHHKFLLLVQLRRGYIGYQKYKFRQDKTRRKYCYINILQKCTKYNKYCYHYKCHSQSRNLDSYRRLYKFLLGKIVHKYGQVVHTNQDYKQYILYQSYMFDSYLDN